MLIKKIFLIFVFAVVYQAIAMVSLYKSSVFNLTTYYTHPPLKAGDIGYQRLPMLWGEQVAIVFLDSYKEKEITELVDNGELSVASILTSYKGENIFDKKEARSRVMTIASTIIENGYDLNRCEYENQSTASVLDKWGMLDDVNRDFLLQYLSKEKLFVCFKNT